jgi:FixJ family two-component response regulator
MSAGLDLGKMIPDNTKDHDSPTLAKARTMKSNKNRPVVAIVDDNAFVCRAMKRLVHLLGMDADTFVSGQEFIDLLEAMPSFAPDCVILDVQMPGLNGLQVQERLTRTRPNIPVIFVTAADEARIREQALASGAVAFLRKPFNNDLFMKTLHAVVKIGVAKEP